MVKQDRLSRADQILFIVGFIAITWVAAFIAKGFLIDHTGLLLVEAVLYVAIIALYVQTFRASRTDSLILFSRVVSYTGITAAILIISFIAYFLATFRW